MSDLRTPLEREIHESLLIIFDYFTTRIIRKREFVEILGLLTDINAHLENKRLGCLSGKHIAECLCSHNIPLSVAVFKRKKRNG